MVDLKKDIKKLLNNQAFYRQKVNTIEGKLKTMEELVRGTRELKALNYDDVSVQTSGTADETSTKAINILDSIVPDIVRDLYELERIKNLLCVCDALMELLTEDERIVIELRYVKNLKWREIARKTCYHMSHGPKKNDKAIDKMEQFLMESTYYYNLLIDNKIGAKK